MCSGDGNNCAYAWIDLANWSEFDSAGTYGDSPPQSTSIPRIPGRIMLSAAKIASSSSLCFPKKRRFFTPLVAVFADEVHVELSSSGSK